MSRAASKRRRRVDHQPIAVGSQRPVRGPLPDETIAIDTLASLVADGVMDRFEVALGERHRLHPLCKWAAIVAIEVMRQTPREAARGGR